MSRSSSAKAEGNARHHNHSSSNRVLRAVTFVLTPFLILVLTGSLCVLLLAKPYGAAKPFADMVFDTSQSSYVETAAEGTNLNSLNIYRDDDAPINLKEVVDEETGERHSIIYPYYGDYYGTVTCESAGMNEIPIYSGQGDDILLRGAGWFNGSVFIGQEGNVVLAAHNHTYFRNLPNCNVGDTVVIDTDFVRQTYIVTDKQVFHQSDYTYVRPTDDDRLTMYTCWNNGRLGMSEYRLAIICELQEREWKEVDK